MSNSAFFYVDGIPTKGLWVELDEFTDHDDVLEALAASNFIPRNDGGEPEYGGDVLVADVEGDLARCFYSSRTDTFDLDGFKEASSYCDSHSVDEGAVAAYIDDRGSWDQRDFEDAYCGEYASEVDYAEELFDECYLHDVPENVRYYIDYEKFARDLFRGGDYFFTSGYVFRRN